MITGLKAPKIPEPEHFLPSEPRAEILVLLLSVSAITRILKAHGVHSDAPMPQVVSFSGGSRIYFLPGQGAI